MVLACGQSKTDKRTVVTPNEPLLYDTSRIVILPIDTANHWVFKDATTTQLTNQDLQTINKLLLACVTVHNVKQDTTTEFSEYIDLKKYKLQYVPFIDGNGHKKVYVNSFRDSDWGCDYWKQSLVVVDDGGSCFFHLTVDLTQNSFEQLFTNGYA